MAPFTQTFLLIHLEPPDNSLLLIYQVTPSSLNDPTSLFSLKMFPNHWRAPGHKPPLMKSGMEVVSDALWLELFPPSPHCWQRVNKGSIVTPSIELLKLVLVFGSWKYHFFPGLLQANDLEPWFLVFICFLNNSPAHAVRHTIITWTAWPGQLHGCHVYKHMTRKGMTKPAFKLKREVQRHCFCSVSSIWSNEVLASVV